MNCLHGVCISFEPFWKLIVAQSINLSAKYTFKIFVFFFLPLGLSYFSFINQNQNFNGTEYKIEDASISRCSARLIKLQITLRNPN